MNHRKSIRLTREHHLDHMVRVVPFIVFCYGIQCVVILKISADNYSSIALAVLAGFLSLMIGAFITYDLKHEVYFYESELHVRFLGHSKIIKYHDIWSMEVSNSDQSFATMTIKTSSGKHSIFFMDDAEKIKAWIEEKKSIELQAAA